MHARFVLVFATILGSHLTNATYHLRAALVTPAPRLNELNARQALQCQHATETVCPDGNGCCPFGQACTVFEGAPACAGTCGSNGPICPNKLCCDPGENCVLSAGNYYCSVGGVPTFTLPKITKTSATITPFIITPATETFPTVTLPTETFPTETFPKATVTVSNAFTQSSGSSTASSSSSEAMTETFSTSLESAAVGSSSSAAVPPTTLVQSGEAAAASEQWFGIVLTWFTGLLLMA